MSVTNSSDLWDGWTDVSKCGHRKLFPAGERFYSFTVTPGAPRKGTISDDARVESRKLVKASKQQMATTPTQQITNVILLFTTERDSLYKRGKQMIIKVAMGGKQWRASTVVVRYFVVVV